MKTALLTIGLVLAGWPSPGHAEKVTSWDFRKPEAVMPIVDGLTTVEKTPEGLRVKTSQDGFIGWQNPPLPATDVVLLYVKNAQPVEAVFMWQPGAVADGNLLQLFFTSPRTETFEKIRIVPSHYPEWTHETPVVAFGFPAGTDLVIQKIEWKSWGAAENVANALRSFWTFDTMSQYSINFLWGPLLATNPETRSTLYESLPPKDMSAMRVVYVLLLCAAAVAGALFMMEKKRQAVLAVAFTVAASWLALDLRMGTEILSYATHDIGAYVLPEADRKELRTLTDVPSMTDRSLELVEGKDAGSIVLLEPAGNAYVSHVRLKAYPLDVASYSESMEKNGKSAWLVVKREDISVKDGAVTDANGRALSSKGSVLRDFGTGSFLFLEQ